MTASGPLRTYNKRRCRRSMSTSASKHMHREPVRVIEPSGSLSDVNADDAVDSFLVMRCIAVVASCLM